MGGKYRPWSQQTQKEKIESLRIRQERIVKSLNLLARRYEPDLDITPKKGAKEKS